MKTELAPSEAEVHRPRLSRRTRWNLYVKWVFICGAAIYSLFHAGFVVSNTLQNQKQLLDIVYAHYACIVVVPFAGYAALALVWLLESLSGEPIEFKAIGFEFKGPAAPIIMWVLCFLAIVAAIAATWPLTSK